MKKRRGGGWTSQNQQMKLLSSLLLSQNRFNISLRVTPSHSHTALGVGAGGCGGVGVDRAMMEETHRTQGLSRCSLELLNTPTVTVRVKTGRDRSGFPFFSCDIMKVSIRSSGAVAETSEGACLSSCKLGREQLHVTSI